MKKIVLQILVTLCFFSAISANAQNTQPSNSKSKSSNAHITKEKNVSIGTLQKMRLAADKNPLAGESNTIELPLFENTTVTLVQRKINTRAKNDFSWIGYVEGYPESIAILVVNKGTVTGQISFAGKLYEINPTKGGLHKLSDIDVSELPSLEGDVFDEENPIEALEAGLETSATASEVTTGGSEGGSATAAPGDDTIDILAIYSLEAAQNYTNIEQRIQLAVDYTNTAYSLSNVSDTVVVNLVAAVGIDHNESGTNSEISWMGNMFDGRMDYVHDLREQYNADVISFWANHIDNLCGQANAILSGPVSPTHILRVSCGSRTFAHELGHNQGARHNMEQDGTLSPFQYGHGSSSPTGQWRTIMSYANACSSGTTCEKISYFSTSTVTLNGEPLGDAQYRDNARVISETGADIAAFSDAMNAVDVTSVTAFTTDNSQSVNLQEIYPGVWKGVGQFTAYQFSNWQVSINGETYGPATQSGTLGGSFSGRLVPNTTADIDIRDTATRQAIFLFDERYNYLSMFGDSPLYTSMYLRGAFNSWAADTPMTYLGNNVWIADVNFQGLANERFKFDVHGDWSLNFGASTANPEDGVASGGGDIPVSVVGPHRVYVDFSVSRYWLVPTGEVEPPANQAPIADAGEDVTVNVGDVVQLDASGSSDPDGTIVSYAWSVGLSGQTTTVIYNIPGVYVIDLTVTDDGGLTSTDSITITVTEAPPTYASVYPEAYLRGSLNSWATTPMVLVGDYTWQAAVTFGDAANERFKIDIYGDWSTNFGDNNNDGYLESSGDDIAITEGAGDYVITFNDQSLTYTVIKDVGPQAPTANAGVDVLVRPGTSVTFDGSATGDAAIVSYQWTSSEWSSPLTGESPSYTFTNVGSYTVTLTVEDVNGLTGSDTMVVTVAENEIPVANIANGDITIQVGDSVIFDGSSSSDGDGSVDSYLWDNGDTTATSTRTFNTAGNFTVSLEVTDNEGASSTPATVSVTVNEVPVTIDVTFTCDNGYTDFGTSVYVVGSLPELGNWTLQSSAQKLDPESYPRWSKTFYGLPADTVVEWKCVKATENNLQITEWQAGGNNQIDTGESGSKTAIAGF